MDKGFGKYDVYAVAGSIYCYRDSNVLKNRFGLRDGAKLRAVEADVSLLRQRELLESPIHGRFTISHLYVSCGKIFWNVLEWHEKANALLIVKNLFR